MMRSRVMHLRSLGRVQNNIYIYIYTDMYIYLIFETFWMIVFGEKKDDKKGNRKKTGDETKRKNFF